MTQHDHATFVPGCYRCDLSAAETADPRPQPDAAQGGACGKLIVTEPCQRVRGHAGPHFASTKGVNPALVYERSRPGAPGEAEQLDSAVTDAYLALLEGKTDAAIGTLAVAMGIRDQPPAPPSAPAQRVPHSDSNQSDLTYMLPPSAPASEGVPRGPYEGDYPGAQYANGIWQKGYTAGLDAAQRQHAAEVAEKDEKHALAMQVTLNSARSVEAELEDTQQQLTEAEAALEAAQQEAARLREALAEYADEAAWEPDDLHENGRRWQGWGRGPERARAALAATPPAAPPAEQETLAQVLDAVCVNCGHQRREHDAGADSWCCEHDGCDCDDYLRATDQSPPAEQHGPCEACDLSGPEAARRYHAWAATQPPPADADALREDG